MDTPFMRTVREDMVRKKRGTEDLWRYQNSEIIVYSRCTKKTVEEGNKYNKSRQERVDMPGAYIDIHGMQVTAAKEAGDLYANKKDGCHIEYGMITAETFLSPTDHNDTIQVYPKENSRAEWWTEPQQPMTTGKYN